MNSLPSAQQLYEKMSARYRELTGFDAADASDIGIRLRVLAQELFTLGERVGRAYADAFPQMAEAAALELHAQVAGLIRRPASAAAGMLRFYRSAPGPSLTIPAGTLCLNAQGSLRFGTKIPGTIPASGVQVDIPAECLTAGPAGNVAAHGINVLLSALTGFSGVSNPASFAGGTSAESDQALRARLMDALSTPPDAANAAYYRGVAARHPGVASSTLLPRLRGVGTLDVVVACSPGFDAQQVAAELEAEYNQSREIGTQVLVRLAEPLAVEIAAAVVTASGFDPSTVADRCATALTGYLAGLDIGQPLLLTRLSGCLLAVEGVENFRIFSPSIDQIPGKDQIIVPGEVDVGKVASL